MANTIVLATDFSPAAQNAADYAVHLAAHLNCSLHVLHTYIIPFAYTDSPVPLLNIDEMQKIAEDSMLAEMDRLKSVHASVPITHAILPGDLMECLAEVIADSKPDLIVMGTSGQGGKGFFWGSMAINALRDLSTAVLVIPQAVQWRNIAQICLAADYKQPPSITTLKQVQHWVEDLSAQLAVVYVSKSEAPNIQPPAQFINELEAIPVHYHSLTGEQIEATVAAFAEQQQVDWLVVLPKKYGFFQNLFHSSRTKLLGQVSKIPILALHD